MLLFYFRLFSIFCTLIQDTDQLLESRSLHCNISRDIKLPSHVTSASLSRENHVTGMRETWGEFAANTTLAGLRYAVGARSVYRRVLWITCMVACGSGLVFFLKQSVTAYLSYPISTEISYEFPDDGIELPTVTICNLNRFVKYKIDLDYNDELFYKKNLNMSVCGLIRGVSGNLTCGQALLCAYEMFGTSVVPGCNDVIRSRVIAAVNRSDRPFNPEEFFAKYGPDFAPMFVRYCRFTGEDERCGPKDWSPYVTDNGLCHTYRNKHAEKVHYIGGRGGLSIILDAQTDENTFSEFSVGFSVVLSTKGAYVNRAQGFNVFPGSHSLVAISPKKFLRLPSPFHTNCSDRSLPGFSTYTKDACFAQCINNASIRDCACRLPGQPGPHDVPVCSIQDEVCRAKVNKRVKSSMCDCGVPCKELVHVPQVTYSKFPNAAIPKILKNHFNWSKTTKYLSDNLVFLQIGYAELAYHVDRQVPAYGSEKLFGDIGGNMGLLLGCSLLTVVEFLDFLWITFVSRFLCKKEISTDDDKSNENGQD